VDVCGPGERVAGVAVAELPDRGVLRHVWDMTLLAVQEAYEDSPIGGLPVGRARSR
jgi:hypothetical protein